MLLDTFVVRTVLVPALMPLGSTLVLLWFCWWPQARGAGMELVAAQHAPAHPRRARRWIVGKGCGQSTALSTSSQASCADVMVYLRIFKGILASLLIGHLRRGLRFAGTGEVESCGGLSRPILEQTALDRWGCLDAVGLGSCLRVASDVLKRLRFAAQKPR